MKGIRRDQTGAEDRGFHGLGGFQGHLVLFVPGVAAEVGIGHDHGFGRLSLIGNVGLNPFGPVIGGYAVYDFKIGEKYHLGPGGGIEWLTNWTVDEIGRVYGLGLQFSWLEGRYREGFVSGVWLFDDISEGGFPIVNVGIRARGL